MNEAIRQKALELGFDQCRITTAEPPSSAEQFQQWLREGRQGEMAYLVRNSHKRVDPQQVLRGAKSLITLATSYAIRKAERGTTVPTLDEHWPAASHEGYSPAGDAGRAIGVVARYARFRDYHHVLKERLRELTDFVNRLGGGTTQSLWYVDTGPLLERDLAQRAGLGFIGKHTNLINRQLGNWFFLSEIITTLELEPESPEPNRCGSCSRCLAACPTNAITAPFQLDARRCISYLTIELKGPIPTHLRSAIGNRIYGCDDCLAVCPWNRFAREGQLMKNHGRQEFEQPDLVELLALDEGGFKRRFADTPMLRTKRRGLLRNVCVALGNVGDEAAVPALEKAAAEPEPLIAEHAQWAIEQIMARNRARAYGACSF
jgi:epoxyqueuosine reductase